MSGGHNSSALAEAALDMIQNDSVVGLGSGRAAPAFVRVPGNRFRAGLRVRCVPTSQAVANLEQLLRAMPGVVGTGLFLGMACTVPVDDNGRIEVRQRRSS